MAHRYRTAYAEKHLSQSYSMPSEAEEQRAVIEWCDALKLPIFHIPNGGHRHKSVATELKRQGVRPGVPDLFLPIAKGNYHGLFIEMKRRDFYPYQASDKQVEWLRRLQQNGYAAFICKGADEAIACIEQYTAL